MPQKRKLQVFVSSTYTDLIEERQSAVEAILMTGHIPAGMELFAGQNEEQMNIIKQWIDESDIYMLIFGGRYGSIEEHSGKSYTHLEFDYAKSIGKTIFAVVAKDSYIEQKVREKGPNGIMELQSRTEYLDFKKEITGKFIKQWDSLPTLQLAIANTLHVLENDETLIGWVRGSEAVDSGLITEQMARLVKENAELKARLDTASKSSNNALYNGLTFEQTCSLLNQFKLEPEDLNNIDRDILTVILKAFGNKEFSLLHIFYTMKLGLNTKQSLTIFPDRRRWMIQKLAEFNLVIITNNVFTVSTEGYQFGLRLQVEYNSKYDEKYLELHPELAARLNDLRASMIIS